MIKICLGALLAPLVLCGFALQERDRVSSASSTTYAIECEVWLASNAELVKRIEGHSSAAVEAVLLSLQEAGPGARRLARVLSPINLRSQARFESVLESPTTTITSTGSGQRQQHFSGYTSEQTSLVLACASALPDGFVTTSLDLNITAHQPDKGESSNPATPPTRHSFKLQCQSTSAGGARGMVQFQTSGPDMLVIFLRATPL